MKSGYKVFIITVLSALLAFLFIGQKSIWLDEAMTITIANHWIAMWHILLYREPYMWLYYLIFYLWTRLGTGEAYVRSLSAVFAVATVPCVYLLGSRLYGKTVGLITGLLLTINTFFIQYAQEVRSYSLLILLITLSSYFLVETVLQSSKKYLTAFAFTSILAIYAHHAALFFIFAQFFSLLFLPDLKQKMRLVFLSGFPILIGIIPLGIFHVTNTNISWIERPTLITVFSFLISLSGGHVALVCLYSIIILIGLISIRNKATKKQQKVSRWCHIYMPILLAVPPIIAYMISITIQPIFVIRYLLPCLIPLTVLGAFGIEQIPRIWIRIGVMTLFIVISAISISVYYFNREPRFVHGFQYVIKENWREATRNVLRQVKPDDAVVFYAYFVRAPFEYYLSRTNVQRLQLHLIDLASSPYSIGGVQPEPNVRLLSKLSAQYSRVWLILSHNVSRKLHRDVQTDEIKTYLTGEFVQQNSLHYDGITVELYSSPRLAD